jgi:ABC-type transporter Mla subunit MlaD
MTEKNPQNLHGSASCSNEHGGVSEEIELLRTQTKWIKMQTVIVSVLIFVLALAVVVLIAKVNTTLDNANAAIGEITALSSELNNVLEETKLAEILGNANDLIVQSGESLSEAMTSVDEALGKVEEIDIDSLNEAITDLKSVVEPLAKLFGKK